MCSQSPDLSVLADRDCLVTFAAMALCCDNSVRDHEIGYHQGGGTAYITAKGVMRRTGLSRTAADRACSAWRRQASPNPAATALHGEPVPSSSHRIARKPLASVNGQQVRLLSLRCAGGGLAATGSGPGGAGVDAIWQLRRVMREIGAKLR